MNKEKTSKLTDKFIKGLQKYNISYDMIKEGKWKYCGGDTGRHLKYYKLCFPSKDPLDTVDKCVCGHKIFENCYITDGDEIVVLGNCCIKRFIKKSSRTCDQCGNPHRNRKVNKCNECRRGTCESCGCSCNPDYAKCYNCVFKF